MTQMNLFTKQKQTHRHREQTCGRQGGAEWQVLDWEFWFFVLELYELFILEIKPLLVVLFASIFSFTAGCLFTLFMVSFAGKIHIS